MNAVISIAAAALVIWASASATAETVIGDFKQWTAYRFDNSDGKACLAMSEPPRVKVLADHLRA